MTIIAPQQAPDPTPGPQDVALASSSTPAPSPVLSDAIPAPIAEGYDGATERTFANIPPTIKSAADALPLVGLVRRLLADGALEPAEPFTRLLSALENWEATRLSLAPGEVDLLAMAVVVHYASAYMTLASTSVMAMQALATAPVPAPWAQSCAVTNIGGVNRLITTTVPCLRERIAHWHDALLLNTVIEDVPIEQRTPAMTDLRAKVGARRALESSTRCVEQPPAPAGLAALEDGIVNTYPTAHADTRARLDTPERMRVLTAMRDESLAHARAATEGDLAPSNDAEPQPCATETDDAVSVAEPAPIPSTARIPPQRVAGPAVEFHSLAELFPLIVALEFDELVDSVRKNGLVELIVLYEGRILDGRNRHRACLAAGVEPRFETYSGTDPIGFVLAKNIHRRHLNASQRAMVATRLEELYAAEAKERQRAAGGDNRPGMKPLPANLPEAVKAAGGAREKAAAALNVSPRLVQDAKKVSRKGASEVIKAVRDGELPVSVAAKLTRETPKVQKRVVAAVVSGKKASAAMAEVKAPDLGKPPKLSKYAVGQQAVVAAQCARINELQETLEAATSEWTKHDPVAMKPLIRSAGSLAKALGVALAAMSGWCGGQSSRSLAAARANRAAAAEPLKAASKTSKTKSASQKKKRTSRR